MSLFRRLPGRLRRALVRAGTPSFTVGAVAVLRRPDGALLLVEQAHSNGWALPGGLLRRGEDLRDGLLREVAEETGLRLDPASLPLPVTCVNARSRRVDAVFLFGAAEFTSQTAQADREVTALGWFALDELPQLAVPTGEILHVLGFA